ncbi:hypothetical protein SPJ2_1966 [Streptococcus parauberis KRS-02109]|uniref:Uncharacterized protein n=1 Tax=Streptococcus parauberis NCFD 2020 TaxID=873447 RepID=F1Z1P3_9STRE|nr:hypothetical protein SPB_2120 [Streptococcus parauberis NCFD 2020]EMF48753.1 hypothetical protein SPJ2_1966 [Streptococcus parauberis KRS-02109]
MRNYTINLKGKTVNFKKVNKLVQKINIFKKRDKKGTYIYKFYS